MFGDFSILKPILSEFPYPQNLISGEFRTSHFVPTGLTPLFHFIFNIVLVCAKPKVIWVAARRIVAAMKAVNSFWYWSESKCISKPVSKPHDGNSCISSDGGNPISPTPAVYGTSPRPTAIFSIRGINHRPKLLNLFGCHKKEGDPKLRSKARNLLAATESWVENRIWFTDFLTAALMPQKL